MQAGDAGKDEGEPKGLPAKREHLKRLEIRELEQRDHKGYEAGPRDADELSAWEPEAAWPAE